MADTTSITGTTAHPTGRDPTGAADSPMTDRNGGIAARKAGKPAACGRVAAGVVREDRADG